jgi:predicted nucleotidyltransferase
MAVTPEETLAHLRRLERARLEAGARRGQRLRALLPEAVRRLRQRGATRIWLFGSLAEGRPRAASDVDLAVEGLPAVDYFAVLGDVMAVFGCSVDLVRLETASESLRDRILTEGQEQP